MTDNPKEEQDSSHGVLPVSAIRMVIQRYRFARILLEESHVVTVGQPCSSLLSNDTAAISKATLGLLAYISFSASATEEKVEQAAKTLLNMPVGTLGAWGDGSGVKSMLQLLKTRSSGTLKKTGGSAEEAEGKGKGDSSSSSDNNSPLSIILVPQANLIAKIKKNGKSIQYRDQIAKERGRELYGLFCQRVQELLQDHYSLCKGGKTPGSNKKPNNTNATPNPSIPPDQLFRRRTSDFATFDDDDTTHVPLTTINGEPLTKSARKRLQKQYKAHVQRHEKWCKNNPPVHQAAEEEQDTAAEKPKSNETATATKSSPEEQEQEQALASLDSSFLQLVQGTFGARQGIELQSDMGPFCHVVEL